MTMNIHNLNHSIDFVLMYGHWRNFSCIHFEDMMGFVKRRNHSTKEFMKTFAITSSLLEQIPREIDLLSNISPNILV